VSNVCSILTVLHLFNRSSLCSDKKYKTSESNFKLYKPQIYQGTVLILAYATRVAVIIWH